MFAFTRLLIELLVGEIDKMRGGPKDVEIGIHDSNSKGEVLVSTVFNLFSVGDGRSWRNIYYYLLIL